MKSIHYTFKPFEFRRWTSASKGSFTIVNSAFSVSSALKFFVFKSVIPHKWIVVLYIGIFSISCKTAQPSASNNPDQFFTISIYSKGSGIDHDAKNIVDNTIQSYSKKGNNITYSAVPWGREGEVDYCFELQKLNTTVYKEFFNELSTLLKDKQVHIKEKVPCRSNY